MTPVAGFTEICIDGQVSVVTFVKTIACISFLPVWSHLSYKELMVQHWQSGKQDKTFLRYCYVQKTLELCENH